MGSLEIESELGFFDFGAAQLEGAFKIDEMASPKWINREEIEYLPINRDGYRAGIMLFGI